MEKQFLNYKDLKVGHIYNKEYTGKNEAYKKCNGKTTFKVISTGKKYEIKELYSFCGDVYSKYLERGPITFSSPINICKGYNVYECPDPKKWFIHKKIMTLKKAIKENLITVETIKDVFKNQSGNFIREDPVTYYSDKGQRYFELLTEPYMNDVQHKKYPYLNSVAFLFKSTEELKLKVREIYPQAWFM